MNKLPKKLTRAAVVLFVCQGSDCKKNGAKKLRKAGKAHLADRGWKKRSVVVKTKCMDGCKRGPICHLQPGDRWLAGPSKSELLAQLDAAIAQVEDSGTP